MNIKNYIQTIGETARKASRIMAQAKTVEKDAALLAIATCIEKSVIFLLEANQRDVAAAHAAGLAHALIDRLLLTKESISLIAQGLRQIAALPDPVGEMNGFTYRPSGLHIGKMRVPLGVIGIIYEARPNVTADAAGLCLKSGNATILRGGSEAFYSNQALVQCIHTGLQTTGLPANAVQFVETTDRAAVGELIQLAGLIDVIIPRGGKPLIKRISDEARVPVIKHLDGNCHVYIDKLADPNKAVAIAVNAKTSRYGTCNTMETLLVHHAAAPSVLPEIAACLWQKGVELRGCDRTIKLLGTRVVPAVEDDWFTEYLAPILAVKLIENFNDAIDHINHYGSHHTDAIITESYTRARRFLSEVDSASVLINASTRFADGYEYGLGAEIGISTDKIHTRGPVGLHGLTNEKWIVFGNGQIRE